MVGVATSNRCGNCAKRKTKCDEAWPTCGTCRRAGKDCPGPGKKHAFVHSTKYMSTTLPTEHESHASNAIANPGTVLVPQTSTKALTGDGIFLRLRIAKQRSAVPALRYPSWDANDREAARVMTCLEWDTRDGMGYRGEFESLRSMPRLFSESKAARHCAAAYVTSWCNLRRGRGPTHWVDLAAYSRAIQSLNEALDNPQARYSLGTYAAAYTLARLDIQFFFLKIADRGAHFMGIAHILQSRGPPSIDDDLEIQLMSQCWSWLMVTHFLENKPFFMAEPEWKQVWRRRQVIEETRGNPSMTGHVCRLLAAATEWAPIHELLRRIPSTTHHFEAQRIALEALTLLAEVIKELDAINEEIIPALQNRGDVRLEVCPDSMFGERYLFKDWLVALFFSSHAAISVVMGRMLQSAMGCLGRAEHSVDASIQSYSRRIWLSHDNIMQYNQLARLELSLGIVMSYEAASNETEKAWVIAAWMTTMSQDETDLTAATIVNRMLSTSKFLTARGHGISNVAHRLDTAYERAEAHLLESQ